MPPTQCRQPAAVPAPHRSDLDPQLTDELASMVVAARRRAVRDGDRQIDTAHLLHALLESDPEVRAAIGDRRKVARLLGYLVQRSIGYGLRWQSSVEDSGAVPALRGPGGLSPAAAEAMAAARRRARRGRRGAARGMDVLAAVTGDPGSRAVEVLRRAGVEPAVLLGRIALSEYLTRY
ncbi:MULTISPECIES: Clp protease N-terminal domain-containing protein [Streptomyces]|uniref:Peptidase n=3 Tax=Streptomyces TaxID=1883 RepID=A0ABZ1VCA2_9ACTN|nr:MULTISPECIES: Clp protease N-terminal domain-containing protein [Streptomyces]